MKLYILFFFLLLNSIWTQGQKNFNLGLVSQVKHSLETNDIWGFVDEAGIEYAVVGTLKECRIYSLQNPSEPQLISTIDGAESIWRDYKSYGNYIYQITQRGEDGLTIIDMSEAPGQVTTKLYKEVLTVGTETDALKTCHNLWIDTTLGIAYLSGCNLGNGGIIMLDIATDPLNPVFIGAEDERYSHDVITKGDTLFTSEINEGRLGIYNISDKANPKLISRTQTSSFFTHNAWYSDDGEYVFTTDERPNAFLDSYDIRDIESPIRLDQYQPVKDAGVIPHNTHYYKGFLVTSWYTEGVVIIDAHRPDNLVKVGQYDTYTNGGSGFEGAWGVYPFLPSGLILVSDITGGLFVLQPEYKKAAYLEGSIIDAVSGAPINAAVVSLDDVDITKELSKADGAFKTGTTNGGEYQVIIEHPDYESETITVTLTPGEVTEIDVRLFRRGSVIGIAGNVTDMEGKPLRNAQLIIQSRFRKIEASTDRDGLYQAVVPMDTYDIYVGAWGYKNKLVTRSISTGLIDPIVLESGYEDDFFVDLGWTVSGDAKRGIWTREIPKATFYRGRLSNPAGDIDTDLNEYCFITGNFDTSVGADDVDDGTTILRSPPIDVSDFKNAIIEITPWFFNGGGDSPPNDSLLIYLVANSNRTLVHFLVRDELSGGRWRDSLLIYVDEIYKRAKVVHLEIHASDRTDSGHLVEGGIDKFRVYEGPLPVYPENQESIEVVIAPNPTSDMLYFDIKSNVALIKMSIYDMSGKLVLRKHNPTLESSVVSLASGVYVIDFLFENGIESQGRFQKI